MFSAVNPRVVTQINARFIAYLVFMVLCACASQNLENDASFQNPQIRRSQAQAEYSRCDGEPSAIVSTPIVCPEGRTVHTFRRDCDKNGRGALNGPIIQKCLTKSDSPSPFTSIDNDVYVSSHREKDDMDWEYLKPCSRKRTWASVPYVTCPIYLDPFFASEDCEGDELPSANIEHVLLLCSRSEISQTIPLEDNKKIIRIGSALDANDEVEDKQNGFPLCENNDECAPGTYCHHLTNLSPSESAINLKACAACTQASSDPHCHQCTNYDGKKLYVGERGEVKVECDSLLDSMGITIHAQNPCTCMGIDSKGNDIWECDNTPEETCWLSGPK